MLRNRYVELSARYLLGIIFIVASIDKISSPEAFAASIHAYRLSPELFDNLLALLIPWIELVCGILLMSGVKVRASSFILSVLLLLFMVAITAALMRGLKIDCGCFGKEHLTPVSWQKVGEDMGLFIVGLYLFFFSGNQYPQAGQLPVED